MKEVEVVDQSNYALVETDTWDRDTIEHAPKAGSPGCFKGPTYRIWTSRKPHPESLQSLMPGALLVKGHHCSDYQPVRELDIRSALAAAETMVAITKRLGGRLAQIAGPVIEHSLSSQVVTMQVIVRTALARGVLLERHLQFIG